MAAVRPPPRFNIIRRWRRGKMVQRSCRKVAVADETDVIGDVKKQSTEDSVDAGGFCGEPFADNGELLSSLSPLLFSMKLFGLYFHREDRHRRRTDDPEWNPATTTTRTSSTGLRVYATVILILVWLNAVRLAVIFNGNDQFGVNLLMKMMVFAWFNLVAIIYSAYYLSNHTGKLRRVLLTLPVTKDCIGVARLAAVGLTTVIWMSSVFNMSVLAYIYFFSTDGEYDFTLAPLVTYIDVPDHFMTVARVGGYLTYMFIFPGALVSFAMSLVLVTVFCHQFKKLKKVFRRAVGKRGHFSGDLASFRQRHQALSRAVDKVDGFLMFSNVGGFVCQIANIILVLYSMIFYPESMATPVSAISHLFWLMVNIKGLLFSASAAIMVNHMAHKMRNNMYDIDLSTLDAKTVCELVVFLSRLNGEPIGFSVLGIFVIDKNTILMVLGLLITYFLLVVQFASPSAGPTFTFTTNCSAPA